MKAIALIIILYFIFISRPEVTIEIKKTGTKYIYQWNGLLWVLLDYYTIIRYHSSDKPMQILICKKEKKPG